MARAVIHLGAAVLLLDCLGSAHVPADIEDDKDLFFSLMQVKVQPSTQNPQVLVDSTSQRAADAVPHFYVDLDKPPQERWAEHAVYYRDFFHATSDRLADYDTLNETTRTRLIDALWSAMGEEYQQELIGYISAAGFSGDELLEKVRNKTFDFMQYELGASMGCSGVVMADLSGRVFHGRNMDEWGAFIFSDGRKMYLPSLTSEVTFVKAGKPVAKWVVWPGGIFPHTAIKFGVFSFQQNSRHFVDKFENIDAMLNHGSIPYSLQARRAMDQAADFQTAVDMLWQGNYMAPNYFVLAGPGPYEGTVLAVDRRGQHLDHSPPITKLSPKGPYRLAQMNTDAYEVQPIMDQRFAIADYRLKFEYRSLMGVTRMADFMAREPIKDPRTIFTFVAVPSTNETKTMINPLAGREPPGPMWFTAAAADAEGHEPLMTQPV